MIVARPVSDDKPALLSGHQHCTLRFFAVPGVHELAPLQLPQETVRSMLSTKSFCPLLNPGKRCWDPNGSRVLRSDDQGNQSSENIRT